MAVAMGSFSIREYTEKMRSVDCKKCWPFDGDRDGGEKGWSLPPISSRKFRWWFDELQVARSAGEKPEEVDDGVGVEENGDEKVIPGSNIGSMVETPPLEPTVDGNSGEAAVVEEEGRLVRVPARGKQRTPKKRSIVELFAVAPLVETFEDDANGSDGLEGREEEGGDEGERDQEVQVSDLGVGVKGGGEYLDPLRKRKVLDLKDDEKKTRKMGKKIKEKMKKSKKKKLKVEICAAEQEKIGKSKMPSPVDIPRILQNKLRDKQFRKIQRNLIDSQKKTIIAKSLPKKRKFNLNRTSRLISRNQKEVTRVLPVRSILKNWKGGTSAKKDKPIDDAQGRNFIKLCCESAKHVSFSGKDDILGLNERHSPHLQNLCKIFSDILAASSAMDNLSKGDKCPTPTEGAQVVDASDTGLARSIERTDGTLSEEERLSDSCGYADPRSFSDPRKGKSPETKGNPLCESVDLNYAVQDCSEFSCFRPDGSAMSNTHAYSGNAKVLNPIHEAKSNCDVVTHGEESSQMTTSDIRNQHSPIEKCVPSSKARSSLTLTRNPGLQQSTSAKEKSLEANKGQHPPCVGSTVDFCSQQPRFQPVHHHSPERLISSISSSVGSKELDQSRLTSDLMSSCRGKSIDEDFIGLPLNSQGELLQLHSNTKSAYSDFYKQQNSARNSVCNILLPNYGEPNCSHVKLKGKFLCASLYEKDQSNWSLEQGYSASKVATSGLGFTDLQRFVRMEIQNQKDFEQFTHCDPNQMEDSCDVCSGRNKTENYIDRVNFLAEMKLDNKFQPDTRPTMRLMGKDVTVGRSNEECPGFNDGKTWTEKELLAQNCPSITVSGEPFLQRWPPGESLENAESFSSRENLFKSLEVPSSFYRMPAPEVRSNPMHLDFQPQWSSRSEMSPAIECHGYDVDLFGHSIPQHLLKKTYNAVVDCNSGTQHVKMGHQQPVLGPCHRNVSQLMHLNPTHCKHSSQSVSHGMPTFNPACPDQDCWSFSRTSIAHSPTFPHWLLNATQQKKFQQSSSPYSAPLSAHHPNVIHGNNVFSFSSAHPTPAISFPFYGSNISQTYALPGPAPVVHHLAIPALGANKSHPAVNTSYRSKKNNNGTKFEIANAKGLDRTDRTRKRSAEKDDASMNCAKKENLNLQEDSNVQKDRGRREQRHEHKKWDTASSEINACGSVIADVGLPALGNQKNNLVATSGPSASNFYPQEKSGFVKLGAGAKHILKPCQNMDEDKSRPVHSTIPFAVGTSSDMKQVSQK